jgi:hypothetical protein
MNQDYAPELLVWHIFLLGILNENQIDCKTDSEASTHYIVPVESKSNLTKGIIIPISTYKALIIESRRNLGFDIRNTPATIGVLIYELDTTIPYHYSPIKMVTVGNCYDGEYSPCMRCLHLNESTISNGFKISLVETSEVKGDVVKIEKAA